MRIKANSINITFNGPEFSSESVNFLSSFFCFIHEKKSIDVIKGKEHFMKTEKQMQRSRNRFRCGGVVRRETIMQHTTDSFFYLCLIAREELSI